MPLAAMAPMNMSPFRPMFQKRARKHRIRPLLNSNSGMVRAMVRLSATGRAEGAADDGLQDLEWVLAEQRARTR